MPFTDQGYEAKRFRDIREEIRLNLETTLGTPISAEPDSVIGVLNSIFANPTAQVENNTQALVSNLSIFTAEGNYLDELVAYIGLSRRPAQSASGSLKVFRNGEGFIPSSVTFSTTAGELFVTPAGLFHTLSDCSEVLLDVATTVVEDAVFTITINNVVFTYTALASDTATEVVNYFVTEIANVLSLTTANEADQLRIAGADQDLNSLNIETTDFSVVEIAIFAFCESVSKRDFTVIENTITQIVTNNPNLLRSNNPLPFTDGLDQETDEELRGRHQRSVQLGGNATVPAIIAKLLQVNGVTEAFIIENRTLLVDGDGRPAKSYEAFVVGGDPSNIGQVIWETKPAGVETYGDINTPVTDNTGTPQAIYWSRPEPIYIFVRVTFSKYDEESYPTLGDDAIKDAVKEYGDGLNIGVDVIPTRFIGNIYQNVSGIDTIQIEVGFSTNIGDTSPSSGYLTTTIPIASSQVSDFALARIDLVEV